MIDKNGKLLEDWKKEAFENFRNKSLNELKRERNLRIGSCSPVINKIITDARLNEIKMLDQLIQKKSG